MIFFSPSNAYNFEGSRGSNLQELSRLVSNNDYKDARVCSMTIEQRDEHLKLVLTSKLYAV